MKKKLIVCSVVVVIFCLLTLFVVSIFDYDGIYSGMSANDFYELIPTENRFDYDQYSFFINKWGNPVIVRFHQGLNPSIAEIHCYSSLWISQTPQAFARIKENMTIFEVTSIVGLPIGSRTSGLWSLDYLDTRGQGYTIFWNRNILSDTASYVSRVDLFNNDFYSCT